MAKKKVDPAQERQNVLAKLASREAASVADKQIALRARMDRPRAVTRVALLLRKFPFKTIKDTGILAEDLVERMVSLLQTADLTHSTKPDIFKLDLGDSLKNCWHLQTGSGLRDRTESKLFSYSGPDATEWMKSFGDRSKKDEFSPDSRPFYAGLNYANCKYGASSAYGKCHFVLKPHMRFNSTFTYEDSFGVWSRHKDRSGKILANYHNMYPLIIYAPDDSAKAAPNVIKALMEYALGMGAQVPELFEGRNYIEAQVHGDVLFERDVEKLVVARSELPRKNILEAKMKAFASKHRLAFEVV